MYYRLKNLKQGARFVDDFTDNCQFQDNDFVGEPVRDRYEQLYQNLIGNRVAYVADPKLDVIVAADDDIRDFLDDVMLVTESDNDLINTNNTDNDGDDADHDAYDDQSQDENISCVVPKFDDSVEDKTVNFVFDVCDETSIEVIMKNCAREDFIVSLGVAYTNLLPIQYELVNNNFCEKDEDSYMNKGKHDYSIYLTNRHRKINSEPPDRGRSTILFFHSEVDLHNKISSSLDEINMCRSITEFVNWDFGKEIPRQFTSYNINHCDFFVLIDALITKKSRVVDFFVHSDTIVVISSREIFGVSYVDTNLMCLLFYISKALNGKTWERRKLFPLLFVVRKEHHGGSIVSSFFFDDTKNALVNVLMWKLLDLCLDMNSSYRTPTKILFTEIMNMVRCLLSANLTCGDARKYKASNLKRRDMVFDPGDFICALFAKDRLPPPESQQASTCSPKIEINNFISPLETFGIRRSDTWILSLRDKRSKEEKDLLVMRVQGSLESRIVLTKALYAGSLSKLHLRQKKKRHEALKRKYYELLVSDSSRSWWFDFLAMMSSKDMESSFKMNIPAFHGGISSYSFLDWLVDVEEILEFQSVSDDRLVSLVVKKFRGQAASWWQQVKTKRKQAGKNPVKSWDKLKQKLCATFLPRNYDHTMYYRLKNLKQGARFVDDFTDNCQFQDNDFVGEPVRDCYEQLYQNLIGNRVAYVADPKLDVIVAADDDIRDFLDDVMLVTESDNDLINTNNTDNDGDDADRDAYDDQSQDENISCVVLKFDDSVEDKTVNFVFDVCDETSIEVIMKNCAREDFIVSLGVAYTNLLPIQYELVNNNFCEKDEDSYMNKGKHDYSIYLTNRHRKINSEPPDRGRSTILFFHSEVDLHNKISSSLDEINMCRSITEFVNWDFGKEIPRQFTSYNINHCDFFVLIDALITKKSRVVDFFVHSDTIVVISSREIFGVSYVDTNLMCLLFYISKALNGKTWERRKLFPLLFVVRKEHHGGSIVSSFFFDDTKNALVNVLMWKLLDLCLDMNSSYRTPTKILFTEIMNMVRCLLSANLTCGDARKYKASNLKRRDMVFDPGDFICALFAKDRLPPPESQQASTCSPKIEINNFISPLETFGIRRSDTWILSLRDKRSKEEKDLLVMRVQGSLESRIVLTKALYAGSLSKLHLRQKKKRHEALKRKYYELVDKGWLQRFGSNLSNPEGLMQRISKTNMSLERRTLNPKSLCSSPARRTCKTRSISLRSRPYLYCFFVTFRRSKQDPFRSLSVGIGFITLLVV
ncbi:unnamed protein product [Arabidopsis halleri]